MQHDALGVVATAPSRVAVGTAFKRDEGGCNVAACVMALREGLVVLMKGADFEDLERRGRSGGDIRFWSDINLITHTQTFTYAHANIRTHTNAHTTIRAENSTFDSLRAAPLLNWLNFAASYSSTSLLAASSIFWVVAEDWPH